MVEMELPASYEYDAGASSSMEKATKWDQLHNDPRRLPAHAHRHATAALMADELAKARALITELEHDKRATKKKLDRFLQKLSEEKSSWKRRARRKVAALEEELAAERRHRRELEAANARLSESKLEQRRSMERAAREMMEEERAEVELLRRELAALREEMEEERRMLQMAELWREERVQMKLADARVALEQKYAQINRLQAEMEAFLLRRGGSGGGSSVMREAKLLGETASVRHELGCRSRSHRPSDREDEEDRVLFEHFRRKEESAAAANDGGGGASPAARSNGHSVSPATDIFLEKLDDSDGDHRRRGSCASAGTSGSSSGSRSLPVGAQGSPLLSNGKAGRLEHRHLPAAAASSSAAGAGNGSGKKNTALIQRIWRSAISESRKLKSSSDHKAAAATLPPVAAPELCAASSSAAMSSPYSYSHSQQQQIRSEHDQKQKQKLKLKQISLQEKLMEARIDDETKHN